MTMDLPTAVDVVDVVLDELVTLHILPLYRYENMSKDDRERLVRTLVTRYGERKDRIKVRCADLKTTHNVSPEELRVGDVFQIYNRAQATSGVVTKINRVNFKYQSVYAWTGEVMNLELKRSDLLADGVIIKRKATP